MPAIAPPPPKPSAPPPATTPTPGPATTPSVTDAHEKPPVDYLGDVTNDLVDLDEADEASKRGEPAPKRGPDGKFIKPADKTEPDHSDDVKPEIPKTEPEKPAEEPKPGTMRALGKAYDTLKKERDEVLQPKVQSLTAKVAEYEKTLTDLRSKQPDLKPFQDQLDATKKENAALREAIRFADFRQSPEFADKYQKPYNEAWAKALSEIRQLPIEMEDGTSRRATEADLLSLANAPLDQLDLRAEKEFGRSAARVIRHVEKIRDLAEAQEKALEDAKKGASEFETKRNGEAQKQSEAFSQAYNGATAELSKKYPKWFAPDEADPPGNELLKKGFDYADTVFGPNGNLTPEQKAGRLAVIRAKAANHDRMVSRLKAEHNRVVELEAELAKFEESEPPTERGGQPSTAKSGDFLDDVEAELKKLDR